MIFRGAAQPIGLITLTRRAEKRVDRVPRGIADLTPLGLLDAGAGTATRQSSGWITLGAPLTHPIFLRGRNLVDVHAGFAPQTPAGPWRVSVPSGQCKRLEPASRRARRGILMGPLATCLAGLVALSACGARPHRQAISVRALETAAAVEPVTVRRAIVSDMREFDAFYHRLGGRLGLFQIRTAEQWEALRRHAPELGPAPDLSRGIVIGLASLAGLPLDGSWPIHLKTVRVHDGAGLAIARFQGGSFLPDGTTYLEAAQFDGLAAVLIVEVNGTRFYPE